MSMLRSQLFSSEEKWAKKSVNAGLRQMFFIQISPKTLLHHLQPSGIIYYNFVEQDKTSANEVREFK